MISDYGEQFMPRRKTKHSAGYDFYVVENARLEAGDRYMIDTGIHLEDGDIPEDAFMMLVPRSSMRKNYGMSFYGVGIIDSDYRDSIKVIVKVDSSLTIHSGERIMQGIVVRFGTIPNEIEPEDEREGGLGSTGL